MSTANSLPHLPARRRGQKGIALPVALFTMSALLAVAASSLIVGSAGIRATRSYRGAAQVHLAAESGLSEALQVINGPGVINFQNDVVNQWGTIYGTQVRSFAPLSGFTYFVQQPQPGANPTNSGRLIATAWGPEGVKNVVVANLTRSSIPTTAPGAIYLASDATTNSDFQGNTFAVDGTDHNYTGGAGPGSPVPGLSTRNQTNTLEAIASLSGGQIDNILGLGFLAGPPMVPSVMTSPAAPSVAQIDQMAIDLLLLAHVTNNNDNINGNATFGTTAAPQITHFPQSTEISGNGNATGAGILIVDGDLIINGNFNFKGLVLVRGRTQVGTTGITGNATVYGTLWTNDVNLSVGGSAICYYSTQALALANQVGGGGALPSPMLLTSLVDCAAVASGTGGCP